jgi:hypothetical protein
MKICYHFEADLPQGNTLAYEGALWNTIVHWNKEYASGARLYQFCTAVTTLVIDTRRGALRAFLLTGCAHQIYHAIRAGRGEESIARDLCAIESEPRELEAEDFELSYIAGCLGARSLTKERGAAHLIDFLRLLDGEWLAELIDQRWLALAVDCADVEAATRFGLQRFARALDLPHSPSRRDLLDSSDADLVQLLQTALHGS